MFRKKSPVSLKKAMYTIAGSLAILMLTIQLLLQSYLVNYVSKVYLANSDGVMESIAIEIRNVFSTLTSSVEHIADSSLVQDYARTFDTELRFDKSYSNVRPIVDAATQNLNFDHLVIIDITGAWYNYIGFLGFSDIEAIKQASKRTITNTILTFDGVNYFCTVKPIIVTNYTGALNIGYVAALSNINKINYLFESYGHMSNFTIALHDYNTVLLSNRTSLSGLSVDNIQANNEFSLDREEVILPKSLGVTITIPTSQIFPQRTSFVLVLFGVTIFVVLLVLVTTYFINRLIVRPISHLIDETNTIDSDRRQKRYSETGVPYVDALVYEINDMLDRLDDYRRRIFMTQQNLYEAELRSKETQLYLLRNQINRHFLYNSLISIRTLAQRGENEKVKEVSGGIAQLLKYTTSEEKEINIFEELEIVNLYVNIQNIRFDNKIEVILDIDDRLCEYKILRLLIQPLVDNALVHGLEQKPSNCVLHIRGAITDNGICIEVEDNGIGIYPDVLGRIIQNLKDADENASITGIDGIALVNIHKRIKIAYGEKYGLELTSVQNKYTQAIINIPAVPDTTLLI